MGSQKLSSYELENPSHPGSASETALKARSLPLVVATVGLILTVMLWKSLADQEGATARRLIRRDRSLLVSELSRDFQTRVDALDRLADRWEEVGKPQEDRRKLDARMIISQIAGFTSIKGVDQDYRVRWVVPDDESKNSVEFSLRLDPESRTLLAKATNTRRITVSQTTDRNQGGRVFLICRPIVHSGTLEGFILANLESREFIESNLGNLFPERYDVSIYEKGQPVFGTDHPLDEKSQRDGSVAPASFCGVSWQVRAVPKSDWDRLARSHRSRYVLGFGVLMTSLVSILLNLVQVAARMRRATAKSYEALRVEMGARKTAESDRARLFEISGDLMCTFSYDGRIRLANAAWKRILGFDQQSVEGKQLIDFVHRDDREEAERLLQGTAPASNPPATEYETRCVAADGSFRWILWTLTRHVDLSVDFAVGHDITIRRRIAQELAQAQKMDALGTLSAGVSHNFNNLLQIMMGYANILLRGNTPPEKIPSYLQTIVHAGHRAAQLVRQLQKFSSNTPASLVELDLNPVVERVTEMLRAVVSENVRVETSLQPGLWTVMADPSELEQIMLNLALNARDAMPDGGTLRITTANVAPDSSGLGLTRHPFVCLSVSDTGVGISPDTLARLFEPFFTTKGPDRGIGLGLAVAHGAISRMEGTVNVESKLNAGATFKINLPRRGEALPTAPESSTVSMEPEVTAERSTILVVEDEPEVRQLMCAAAKDAQMLVLEASTGEEALLVAERHSERIDVLVSDVVMPGISGPELARRLRISRPNLAVVLVTGHSPAPDHLVISQNSMTRVLRKPFALEVLMGLAREMTKAPAQNPA